MHLACGLKFQELYGVRPTLLEGLFRRFCVSNIFLCITNQMANQMTSNLTVEMKLTLWSNKKLRGQAWIIISFCVVDLADRIEIYLPGSFNTRTPGQITSLTAKASIVYETPLTFKISISLSSIDVGRRGTFKQYWYSRILFYNHRSYYWASLSLSFRLISMLMNILAWPGPQVNILNHLECIPLIILQCEQSDTFTTEWSALNN